jgi:hypothetical protein
MKESKTKFSQGDVVVVMFKFSQAMPEMPTTPYFFALLASDDNVVLIIVSITCDKQAYRSKNMNLHTGASRKRLVCHEC